MNCNRFPEILAMKNGLFIILSDKKKENLSLWQKCTRQENLMQIFVYKMPVQEQRCTHFDELDISDVTCLWRNQNTLWRNSYEWALTEEQYKEFRGRVFSAYECLCVSYFKSLVNKGVMKCVFSYWSCIMSSYSCIGSRSAVLARGEHLY